MKKSEEVNEVTIKHALKEGLITAEEARIMLMVYLKRSDFIPIQSQTITNPDYSITNHHLSK
jgi:hypothetical protein